jgi:dCTP deaminase
MRDSTIEPSVAFPNSGIMADKQIRSYIKIDPFVEKSPPGVISYGLTSYGYDMRIDRKFKVFTNLFSGIVDPKNFDKKCFVDIDSDFCIIPPNSFALGVSIEKFIIPRNVLAVCVGKSTYARCGVIINVTPLEPEWEGLVTLEVSNTTPNPVRIYSGEGIAQVLFFMGSEACDVSYLDKKGRYQNQTELTLPFVK